MSKHKTVCDKQVRSAPKLGLGGAAQAQPDASRCQTVPSPPKRGARENTGVSRARTEPALARSNDATLLPTELREMQSQARELQQQPRVAMERTLLTSPTGSPASLAGQSTATQDYYYPVDSVQSQASPPSSAPSRQSMQSSPQRGSQLSPDGPKKSRSKTVRIGDSQTMTSFHTAGSADRGLANSSSSFQTLPAASQTWHAGGHAGGFPGAGQMIPSALRFHTASYRPGEPEPYIEDVWERHPHADKDTMRQELINFGATTPPSSPGRQPVSSAGGIGTTGARKKSPTPKKSPTQATASACFVTAGQPAESDHTQDVPKSEANATRAEGSVGNLPG